MIGKKKNLQLYLPRLRNPSIFNAEQNWGMNIMFVYV